MKRIPTDLELLNAIHEEYYDDFASYDENKPTRSAKVYVPIDIYKLGAKFGVDPDIIFGRLYYHLDKKYGYKDDSGAHVHLFSMVVGGDRHCIQFPFAASILADLRTENRKYRIATTMAVISLVISVTSFTISILRAIR
jgi:hypothetical protein